MDKETHEPSRRELKIGHTIIGGILVGAGILIASFASGNPVVVNIVAFILIGYGLIKVVIAQTEGSR